MFAHAIWFCKPGGGFSTTFVFWCIGEGVSWKNRVRKCLYRVYNIKVKTEQLSCSTN